MKTGMNQFGLPLSAPLDGTQQHKFQKVFDDLWVELLALVAIVETTLHTAVTAFVDGRLDLAGEVRRHETRINDLEVQIEEDCLKVLALYQPVASDLRRVATVLRVNGELERMGDLARHIAKRVKKISHESLPPSLSELMEELAQSSLNQVHEGLDALTNNNAEKARRVRAADHFVDQLRRDIINAIKDHVREEPARIDLWLRLIDTARNLERIADHARNIAETVVYLSEGTIIRHAQGS